jgi:GTPase SAR1 family protein
VRTKWFPEIRLHMPNTPFILVGTKADLRNNAEVLARLRAEGRGPVTTAEGQGLADELGASLYLECSALTQQGLKAVFDEAIVTAMEAKSAASGTKGGGKGSRGKCDIM